MQTIGIVLTLSDQGWNAASPDLPTFALHGESFMKIVAELPAALYAHCGQPVEFKVVQVRAPNMPPK